MKQQDVGPGYRQLKGKDQPQLLGVQGGSSARGIMGNVCWKCITELKFNELITELDGYIRNYDVYRLV